MIRFSHAIAIAKKELRAAFDNPTAYVVLAVFLLLWEFLFFRNAFLVAEASMRGFFELLPWLSLILVPAVTMASFSQERTEGTIELLLTHPLRIGELLVGKWLGCFAFAAIAFLIAFPIAGSLSAFGQFDWGELAAQYFAGLGLAMTLTALGVFISSLFKNQIASLLVTTALSFLLMLLGSEFVTATFPLSAAPVLEQLSTLTHVNSMARGVIDVRDVWYFLTSAAAFLSLAFLNLLRQQAGNRRWKQLRGFGGVMLFLAFIILSNAGGRSIPGRIDLTQDGRYSLSDTTKRVLGSLPDSVTVTLYASAKLPAQLQPALRELKDLLRDYRTYGKGKLLTEQKDPSAKDEIAKEARERGVQEVQFNVVGRQEYQVQRGFLGLSIGYASSQAALPFLADTNELEYELTSQIKKLTAKDKKTVRFLEGHGEKTAYGDMRGLNEELMKQYEIDSWTWTTSTPRIPENTAALVIAGPTQKLDAATVKAARDYVDRGGSVLALIEGFDVDAQRMTATASQERLEGLLGDYGVEALPGVLADLRSNETVRVSGGIVNYVLPYPYWIRAPVANRASPIVAKLQNVALPWAAAIKLDAEKAAAAGFESDRLIETTKFALRQIEDPNIAPNRQLPANDLGVQLVAASLIKKNADAQGRKGRLVVVGNAQFLTDGFLENAPENLAFGSEALGWLAQEESLAAIQAKRTARRKLLAENDAQIAIVKYGNFAFALLLPAGIGIWRTWRRRRLGSKRYETN